MTLLGDMVKARREHLGLGLRDAAKIVKVSHATLSRVERGEPRDIETFARLCHWIGLSSQLFLSDTGLK